MEIVLHVDGKNYQKFRDAIFRDENVSRASIVFKEAKIYGGSEGYYCYIFGSDHQCKKALEISKDLAKKLDSKKEKEFISKLKEEENKAAEAFGDTFG